MTTERDMDHGAPRKGAIIKLFGVVLIFLGAMDSMLSWRGGFAVAGFYIALIAAGFVVYALGAVRGADRRASSIPISSTPKER